MKITISREALLQRGGVGTALMAAIVLLCVFYSIVTGAVDRAAQRRASLVSEAEAAAQSVRRVGRSNAPPQTNAPLRAPAFGARNVAYVRFVN
jgi:hypothetical protein